MTNERSSPTRQRPTPGRQKRLPGPDQGPRNRTRPGGAAAFVVPPFARLARTHGFVVAGDALVSISLAGTLFFNVDPNDARWQVALYLMLTMAPFAIVAPLLGPFMDQLNGGHRYVMIGAAALRAVLALGMAKYVDSLVLFPLAFSMLVLGKTHHISKSALVASTVRDPAGKLVQANSRLSMISAISAAIAGIPGVVLLKIGGAPYTLVFASVIFAIGAGLGLRIPSSKVADTPADLEEKAELRGCIILAASAMGFIRALVGFLTMFLAFELRTYDPGPSGAGVEIGHQVRAAIGLARLDLRSGGAPTWHFGLVLLASGTGGFAGAALSPRLRKVLIEERILLGMLVGIAAFGLLAAVAGGLAGAMSMAAAVAVGGQMGRQSFDAIVQRDAPEANLGRSFLDLRVVLDPSG
ncbi:MAG: hypothetical protein R2706_15200 [Acidimicrobiales bacterium]